MSSLIKSDVLFDSCGGEGSWAGVVGIWANCGRVIFGRAAALGGSEGGTNDFFIGLMGFTGEGTEGKDSFREDSRDFSGVGSVVGSLLRVRGNGVEESRVGGSGRGIGEGFSIGRSTFLGGASKGLGLTGADLTGSGSGERFTCGTLNG